jgi:hypothetical protein
VAVVTTTSEQGKDAHSPVNPRHHHKETQMSPEQVSTSTDLVPVTNGQPVRYDESISTADLVLPKLQVAHSSTRAVQEQRVPFGALFVAIDADDPEPQVLYHPGHEEGVVVHLLGKRDVWTYRD